MFAETGGSWDTIRMYSSGLRVNLGWTTRTTKLHAPNRDEKGRRVVSDAPPCFEVTAVGSNRYGFFSSFFGSSCLGCPPKPNRPPRDGGFSRGSISPRLASRAASTAITWAP